MPVTVHPFVNPKADGGDATITRPSNWNEAHADRLQLTTDTVIPAASTTVILDDPLIIDSGILLTISSTGVLWTDASPRVQQLPQTWHAPTANTTLIPGGVTIFDTLPLVVDVDRLIDIPVDAVIWTDAPRPAAVTQRYLYLPTGWDAVWQSAKAGSRGAAAFVAGLGMSTQSGHVTTNPLTKNYFRLIRDTIISQGYLPFGEFYDVKQSGPTNGYDAAWTTTSPWVFTNAPTFPGYGWNLVAAGPALTTFAWSYTTVNLNAIALHIIYWDGITSGSWGYNVDGGATQTVNVVSSGAGKAVQKRVVVDATTPGWNSGTNSHVINFTTQDTAASKLYLQGVSEIYNTVGIGFAHTAHIGATVLIAARVDSLVQPTDKMIAWQGNSAQFPGPFNTGFGFPTQPHLAIIELGGNDTADPGVVGTASGAGPEQFYHGMRRLIDALRRGRSGCSIVFVATSIPGPDSNSCDFNGTSVDNPTNWPMYLRVMDHVAHEYNCAFVNIHAKWGENPLSMGFCTATDFHATDAGHADIAALLAQIL